VPGDDASTLGTGWSERYLGGSETAEAEAFADAVAALLDIQAEYASRAGNGELKRTQHAKRHAATLNAEFHVVPDVPPHLRFGLFQPGAKYQAAVRFSNASGRTLPDEERDLRGIAVRVMSSPNRPNDFLATNYPASHAKNVRQFVSFAQAVAPGTRFGLIRHLLTKLGPRQAIDVLRNVTTGTDRPVASLALETYWSRSPFQLGAAAMRFSLKPSGETSSSSVPAPDRNSPDGLRLEFEDRLREGPVAFDFAVQLFVNEAVTPIEDASSLWDPNEAPEVTIANLVIPQQDLSSSEAKADAEAVDQMGFNPWNGADTFRPLGELNRARRLAYPASQDRRGATTVD
jgi:hypothetical protein